MSKSDVLVFRDIDALLFFESLGGFARHMFYVLHLAFPESTRSLDLQIYILGFVKLRIIAAISPLTDHTQGTLVANFITYQLVEQLSIEGVFSAEMRLDELRLKCCGVVHGIALKTLALPEDDRNSGWLNSTVADLRMPEHSLDVLGLRARLTTVSIIHDRMVERSFSDGRFSEVADWETVSERFYKTSQLLYDGYLKDVLEAGEIAKEQLSREPELDWDKHQEVIHRIRLAIFGEQHEREIEQDAFKSSEKSVYEVQQELAKLQVQNAHYFIALAELKSGKDISRWKNSRLFV